MNIPTTFETKEGNDEQTTWIHPLDRDIVMRTTIVQGRGWSGVLLNIHNFETDESIRIGGSQAIATLRSLLGDVVTFLDSSGPATRQ